MMVGLRTIERTGDCMKTSFSWFISVTALALLLCCVGISLAEDYADCRSKCTNDYTDCMNQPQVTEPEVEVAKEANCTEKVQLCYNDCENLRTPDTNSNDNTLPEANPNIIVR
jgi:hypothetical protein